MQPQKPNQINNGTPTRNAQYRSAGGEKVAYDPPVSGGSYRHFAERGCERPGATIVRVPSDAGLEGWGGSTRCGTDYLAAHAAGVRTAIAAFAPGVLGRDPRRLDRINDAMDAVRAGHHSVRAPIDVACRDIPGRRSSTPACDPVGGRFAGPVPLIWSIGTDDPDRMGERLVTSGAGLPGPFRQDWSGEAECGPALDSGRIRACLSDRRDGEGLLPDASGGPTAEHPCG